MSNAGCSSPILNVYPDRANVSKLRVIARDRVPSQECHPERVSRNSGKEPRCKSVILNEVKDHYMQEDAKRTDPSLRSG